MKNKAFDRGVPVMFDSVIRSLVIDDELEYRTGDEQPARTLTIAPDRNLRASEITSVINLDEHATKDMTVGVMTAPDGAAVIRLASIDLPDGQQREDTDVPLRRLSASSIFIDATTAFSVNDLDTALEAEFPGIDPRNLSVVPRSDGEGVGFTVTDQSPVTQIVASDDKRMTTALGLNTLVTQLFPEHSTDEVFVNYIDDGDVIFTALRGFPAKEFEVTVDDRQRHSIMPGGEVVPEYGIAVSALIAMFVKSTGMSDIAKINIAFAAEDAYIDATVAA